MEELLQRRNEIDRRIRDLYKERMQLEEEMASETAAGSLRQLLTSTIEHAEKSFPEYASVACQGVEGAYSEAAARKLFKYPGISYFRDFEHIFSAIESGLCQYGILPIENSTAGSVNRTYDLMCDHKFYIVRSVRLKIDHVLMAPHGTKIEDIREIYTHQQAFAQCDKKLKQQFSNVRMTIVSNTAEAARTVAASRSGDKAAICSPQCAAVYGLQPLIDDIQDHNYNYTRFICITKRPEIYAGADKTSFLAVLANKPGSLYEVLKKFNDIGYNLIKLESRPIPDTEFQFMFYFDFEASIYHKAYIDTLCDIEEQCERMEYLGSYNEKV